MLTSIQIINAAQERVALNYSTDGSIHLWNLPNFEHFEFANGMTLSGSDAMDLIG